MASIAMKVGGKAQNNRANKKMPNRLACSDSRHSKAKISSEMNSKFVLLLVENLWLNRKQTGIERVLHCEAGIAMYFKSLWLGGDLERRTFTPLESKQRLF